jgi:hypothetical protein
VRRETGVVQLTTEDISVGLLVALSTLSRSQREAWIDAYVLGRGGGGTSVRRANRALSEYFGSPGALLEAA